VHDIVDLETRGIPGVFVASNTFVDAAETQSKALGYNAPAVFVPHPIQDRTDEEMRSITTAAIEPLLKAICTA